jgi:hypothetical protein
LELLSANIFFITHRVIAKWSIPSAVKRRKTFCD